VGAKKKQEEEPYGFSPVIRRRTCRRIPGTEEALDQRSPSAGQSELGRTPVPEDISCLVVGDRKNMTEREAYLVIQSYAGRAGRF